MTKIIHDIETGEIVEVEETATEKAYNAQLRKQAEELLKQTETKDAAKQAVLDKLGLSADEVAALLG